MGLGKIKKTILLAICFFITIYAAACTTGHCRGRKLATEKRVFVAKPNGHVQCRKDPSTLEQMGTELAEISIYSKKVVNDGMMRTALCGSPKGDFNVYEINESDLERALSLGFKLWNPQR